MFDYDVMEEEEAMQERFQILKEGEYDGIIEQSEDTVSASSGNPMMAMTLNVFDQEGRPHSIKDYLVFTKNMMWKVIHCADSAGLSEQYKQKKFCSNTAIGKSVRVRIGIESGKLIPEDKLNGKAFGSKYPDKNKVEDYLKNLSRTHSSQIAPEDQDVPF